jgi:hypothetical protein
MTTYWHDNQAFTRGKTFLIISTGNFMQMTVGRTMTVLYPKTQSSQQFPWMLYFTHLQLNLVTITEMHTCNGTYFKD